MDKKSKFSERLVSLMEYMGMSKTELAKICGIDKSNITRYCKGDYEAKQDVVYTIASRLGIDAAWLMGYDVPMKSEPQSPQSDLSAEEQALVRCWRQATDKERQNIAFILRDYGMPFPQAEPEAKLSRSSG